MGGRKRALESMGLSPAFWKNKRVFITGHTGFKGAWLTLLLKELGANISGYSLIPPSRPNLFELLNLKKEIRSIHGDVRNSAKLKSALNASKPQIIFHLAAQSLVHQSYRDPITTFETNIMGTANLILAAQNIPSLKALVNVTSDKCYENKGLARGYHEDDPLGGYDPYSSSKACQEIVGKSLQQSFLKNTHGHMASARAGNVIGGGDWAADRLIPDLIRAAAAKKPLYVRNPKSTRPWQFVLDPLHGYISLAQALWKKGKAVEGAWNFGPSAQQDRPVSWVLNKAVRHLSPAPKIKIKPNAHHEARVLKLNPTKAHRQLKWKPQLTTQESIRWTMDWYNTYLNHRAQLLSLTRAQIRQFIERTQS